MNLPEGIVTLSSLQTLRGQPLFTEMSRASSDFVDQNSEPLGPYISSWVKNPFEQWSRQFEYPFVFDAIKTAVNEKPDAKILDAGSGITFFPYFVSQHSPNVEMHCCDYDDRLANIYQTINQSYSNSVDFKFADMREMPYERESFDIVYCVSVLEHTGAFRKILAEFHRILRASGTLILTFDISVDGSADIPLETCRELISDLSEFFETPSGLDWNGELKNVGNHEVLSTRAIAKTEPELLPWKYPAIVAIYKSLRKGQFPTTLFRDLNCYCLVARKR